jgi:hypothetical protein
MEHRMKFGCRIVPGDGQVWSQISVEFGDLFIVYGLKYWCLYDAKIAYCLRIWPYLGTNHGAVRSVPLDWNGRIGPYRTTGYKKNRCY